MFVCVFAKKFPALASQSCCEVSRPRAVGEYEYRLLFTSVSVASQILDAVIALNEDLLAIARWCSTNSLVINPTTFSDGLITRQRD